MYYHTPNHQLNIHFPLTANPFLFREQAKTNKNSSQLEMLSMSKNLLKRIQNILADSLKV